MTLERGQDGFELGSRAGAGLLRQNGLARLNGLHERGRRAVVRQGDKDMGDIGAPHGGLQVMTAIEDFCGRGGALIGVQQDDAADFVQRLERLEVHLGVGVRHTDEGDDGFGHQAVTRLTAAKAWSAWSM